LNKENLTEGVYFVGDVMYDLFIKVRESINLDEGQKKYGLEKKQYRVLTIHRDFNTDDKTRFERILKAVKVISEKESLLFPIHPRTRKVIKEYGFEDYLSACKVVDPVGYTDLVSLLCNSKGVITDSGGLQKEAYFAGVPAVVLMEDTGWRELIDIGWNCLVDDDTNLIVEKALNHHPISKLDSLLYGSGDAGEKIAGILYVE
jgi:UDP-N-acetylglucosamine 2-epimerase (non-hydrolysing)